MLPTLEEFLTYLENRAVSLLEWTKNSKENSHVQMVVEKVESKCECCNNFIHRIYNCKKLKSVTINEEISSYMKRTIAKFAWLNILAKKYYFKLICNICNKNSHNSLLQYEKLQKVHELNSNSYIKFCLLVKVYKFVLKPYPKNFWYIGCMRYFIKSKPK